MSRAWPAVGGVARGAAAALVMISFIAGCRTGPQPGEGAIDRGPPPTYAEVAAEYNNRVERLISLRAETVVRIEYTDEDGERRNEQGEGLLQAVRPSRLALSINKAGKRLFWIGCNEQRYWWIDLTEDPRTARVGRHENYGRAAQGPGLAIHPLDVIGALGITPLPEVSGGADDLAGTTEWSLDGRRLGVTARARNGGYQRLWLDPANYEPLRIELLDAGRSPVLVAELAAYRYPTIAGFGGLGPRLPAMIEATHLSSDSRIRLDLANLAVGSPQISAAAFDFNTLVRSLGVERTIDLDASAPQAMSPAAR